MKIIVGYDGSKSAATAVEAAKKRALESGAEVVVVTSLMVPDTVVEKKAEAELAGVVECFKDTGITVKTELLVRGLDPGEDLEKYAEENNVDEIVIGLRKRSKVGKILFGSTAQYVILNMKCPVVVVK